MRSVKKIQLILENCEAIEVSSEHLTELHLGGLTRGIYRIAVNEIREITSAERVMLKMSAGANDPKAFVSLGDERIQTPFERLMEHRDIVEVLVVYEDDAEETIYVPWSGDSDLVNASQQCVYDSETNVLCIFIQ